MGCWLVCGNDSGLTEVSFLPAKAILSLERKAETEKVREQLAILLRSDCVSNLDICNFFCPGHVLQLIRDAQGGSVFCPPPRDSGRVLHEASASTLLHLFLG